MIKFQKSKTVRPNNIMKNLILALSGVVLLSGCTLAPPPYTPNYDTLDRLKKLNLNKISIGEVQPRDPNASVNSITLRGSTLSPSSGTFATYIEDAIRSDLTDVGLYDNSSSKRINANILQNDIDTSSGLGKIEISLNVSDKNTNLFSKRFYSQVEFETSFVGAIAIPNGQNAYPKLVRSVLDKIYLDADFISAMKK